MIKFYKNALKERGKETILAIVLFLFKSLFSKSFLQNPISKLLSWLIKDNLVNKESNVNILEIKRPSWPDYTKMTWRTEGKKHYGPLFFSSFYAFFQSHFFKILSESFQVQWAHVKILYLTRPKWESYSKITCQIEGKKQSHVRSILITANR